MQERDLLQTIMESTQAHIAYLDSDLNFVLVNQAYVEGSGHSREELLGRNHFDLFPNAENETIFKRVRDTGEKAEFKAKPFTYVDQPWRGTTYWDWTLVPVKDSEQRVQGLVLSLLDVTEQVVTRQRLEQSRQDLTKLNEELAQSLEELRRLEQAKSDYLQVLAHELRNPLTAARGLVELVRMTLRRAGEREQPADHSRQVMEYLNLAEVELERLQRLISDIITGYRISSGRLPLELEPLNLISVIEQATAPYSRGVFRTNLVVEEFPAADIPVMGDAHRLVEVLTNLLDNAVKYSPPDAPITVRVILEPGSVVAQVEDQGIGIPPEQLERVFEGFYRGSNLQGKQPGGMGLGLYVSRDIARRHGGDLWAANRPGGGTIVSLRLPLDGGDDQRGPA